MINFLVRPEAFPLQGYSIWGLMKRNQKSIIQQNRKNCHRTGYRARWYLRQHTKYTKYTKLTTYLHQHLLRLILVAANNTLLLMTPKLLTSENPAHLYIRNHFWSFRSWLSQQPGELCGRWRPLRWEQQPARRILTYQVTSLHDPARGDF